jgi:hypothetical protein
MFVYRFVSFARDAPYFHDFRFADTLEEKLADEERQTCATALFCSP